MREVVRVYRHCAALHNISAVTIAVELGRSASRTSLRFVAGPDGGIAEPSRAKTPAASVFEEEALPSHGNAHLRRIVVEIGLELSTPAPRRGQAAQTTGRASVQRFTEIAWKAQNRLHKRYMTLMAFEQGSEKDHDGGRTRTVGLYLGHRDQGEANGLQTTNAA